MVYKYEMYFNDIWNDMTPYVQTNASLGDRLDLTMNHAFFIIPHISADTFTGIDLSLPFKPWIPVKVTIDEELFLFYTSNCTRNMVKKTEPRLYRHDVELIEPSRILQRKTIPDITVTQPKSKQFSALYSSEQKSLVFRPVQNTQISPPLTLISESEDTSFVEGTTIKANNPGEVIVTFDFQNYQYNKTYNFFENLDSVYQYSFITDSGEATVRAELYINGTMVKQEDFFIPARPGYYTGKWYNGDVTFDVPTPSIYTYSMAYNVPSSSLDQVIEVKLKTLGVWNHRNEAKQITDILEDEVDVKTYLTVGAGSGEAAAYVYLDELAEKILTLQNIRDKNDPVDTRYRLDQKTIADFKVLSPEYTFTNYTVWDALEKIANTRNAIPEIKEDFQTISFRFLDDIPDMYYEEEDFEDETIAYTAADYVSGLEINAPNLIEEDVLLNAKIEPYEGGWSSVRSDDTLVGQVTDDNATFKTRQLIQNVYKVLIKNIGIRITNGTTEKTLYGNLDSIDNETSASYWDISERVLSKNEWDVYEDTTQNKEDSQRTGIKTKGNHIYFEQGTNSIKGLGHKTLTTSDIFGTKEAPRSIYETIMATCADYLAITPEYANYNIVSASDSDPESPVQGSLATRKLYNNLLYRVYYVPLTNARTTLYKHNIFNSESFLVDYINEQDKLNDTMNLGKYVSSTLNRQGNMEYTVSGKTDNYNNIPKIGFRAYNDLVVGARDLNLNKNIITYTLRLTKDFVNRSEFIGRDSKYRSFEIPNNETVHRQDKYTQFIVLSKDINNVLPIGYEVLTLEGKQMLVQNFCSLAGANTNPAGYAKVEVVPQVGDTAIPFDMPLNVYSIGTTVNLQLEFPTNYSAGDQVKDKTIFVPVSGTFTEEDIKLQEYLQYTDVFGQVYSMKTIIYPTGAQNNNKTDADLYPAYSLASSDADILNIDLLLLKDAREKYGLNIEFPFISDDSDTIRTYTGIAKYSAIMRSKNDIEVGVALLDSDYFPTINEYKLNKNRTRPLDAVGTSVYNTANELYGIRYNLPIPANNRFNGYAVYEKNTEELIYVVKEDIAPFGIAYTYTTDTIYFIPKKDLKDSTKPEI